MTKRDAKWGGKKWLFEPVPGYVYVRRHGKVVARIHAPFGSPEFDAEYWAIVNGRPARAKQSWNMAFEIMRATPWWQGISPRYEKDITPVIQYLSGKIGPRSVMSLTQADIYGAMKANAHRVRFANYIPTVLSRAYKEVAREGWKVTNHAIGIEPMKVPKDRRAAHIPWTDDAVATMRAEAKRVPRLIFELGVGTVQRPEDLTRFTWGDFDGTSLALTQGKTGRALRLPCTPSLLAVLQEERGRVADDLRTSTKPMTILRTARDGNAMTYRSASQAFLTERKRLGLTDHDMHALRYRGIEELAWSGCTDEEIASYSGHMSMQMIRKYAGRARQEMRAKSAAEKRGRG